MAEIELGYFGDERLRRNGALFAQRVCERQTVCLRKLGDDRAEKVKLQRFVRNERVTVAEMLSFQAERVSEAVEGRHVLAIQDTSEINYQSQRGRKRELGVVGNGKDVGLFVHPVLGIDAQTGACLGLIDAQIWRRHKRKAANYHKQEIEKKESYRWLRGGDQAKEVLARARMVTIIDDREGDIYEKWARLPDERTQLLTRAAQDRRIADGGTLFEHLDSLPEVHRFSLDLPARARKRSARKAHLAVRFGRVRICRPGTCSDRQAPHEVELYAIDVCELDASKHEAPVHWRLLTTHTVESVEQALTVVGWYRMRWNIEQLFRTLKTQGLGIEQSVIEDGEALEKIAFIALAAATITLQLVLARTANVHDQPATHAFDQDQIEVLQVLQMRLQGKTDKQRNPYPSKSLAWASWTITRLGGWTGHQSDKSTGPITMRDGLERFYAIAQGYLLSRDLCPS